MAEERLRLIYDGPAVAEGRIAVRDLAPSLLAFADLVQDAQFELYPDDPRVSVQISATRDGSFEIDLTIVNTLMRQARNFFASDTATAAVNLGELVGGVWFLFQLVKRLAGRAITRREPLEEGEVRLVLDDGTEEIVRNTTLTLYDASRVRRDAQKVVEPLAEGGTEELHISYRDDTVTVAHDEREAFEPPELVEDLVEESTNTRLMRIASISFKPGNKWRLSDGTLTYYVSIEDQSFIDRVQRNEERFGNGDLLRVDFTARQILVDEGDGLKSEYIIDRVHRHIPADQFKQTSFPDVLDRREE